jgi:DNA-binding transcriptional LysR family regulator
MDFKIRTLRYFLTVAEEGSITKAAELLSVAQPSLSQRIRTFEELLGFNLFDRTRGQLVLTPEGKVFLPIAKQLVDAAAQAGVAVRNLQKGHYGTLRIGGSWFGLNSPELRMRTLIDDFAEQNPKIEVIVVRESYSPALLSRIQHNELDVAFVSGSVNDDEFDYLPVRSMFPNLLLPREHKLANLAIVPAKLLKGLQIAWYRRENYPALYDATVKVTNELGIVLLAPPDTNYDGIARFAQRHRIATFAFRDMGLDFPDMVSLPIEGNPISFEWSLVRLKGVAGPCVLRYWTFVKELVDEEGLGHAAAS